MKLYRALMDGVEIANRIDVANGPVKRLFGLLPKKEIDENEGMLLSPCSQIHTIGMKFQIDAVFLSKSGEVLHIEKEMGKGIVSPIVKHCHQVLELKSGTIEKKGIDKGCHIAFDTI